MHFPWAQVSFVDGQVSIEAPDRTVLIEARSSRDLPSPLAPEVPVLLRLNMTERGGVFTNDAGHWSINWVKQVHGAERLPWTLFCFSSCFFPADRFPAARGCRR